MQMLQAHFKDLYFKITINIMINNIFKTGFLCLILDFFCLVFRFAEDAFGQASSEIRRNSDERNAGDR